MAAEFDNNMEDDFVDYVRERSNTWPRSQLKLAEQSVVFSPQFSPLASQCSSQLSLITESNESINTSHAADGNRWGIDTLNCRKQSSPAVISNYKAGHPSYVELITQAILSSPEKRMTLSEIYDWMVANVSAFKDQRHLHSSTGWKVMKRKKFTFFFLSFIWNFYYFFVRIPFVTICRCIVVLNE